MAYSKKIFLIVIFAICLLFFLNSNVFAYSFVDKDGQVYTTTGDPEYYESPIQLVTFYDGHYYFFCPAIPNQSGWYWYTDTNGYLKNSFENDSDLGDYNTIYVAQLVDEGQFWNSTGFTVPEEALFYENLTYNASPIYDSYGSSLILKPSMSLENQDGMARAIEMLSMSLNSNTIWNVFSIVIPFVLIIVLFILGYYFIKKIMTRYKK